MAWPSTPLVVEVSLALGADLTASPSSWSWTDVTQYAFDRNRESSIFITRGRSNEATESQPATCTLELNNRDGRFTRKNPLGPYYPNLRKNTPIRVRVDPGTGLATRFVGYVSEWPLRTDLSERHQWVPVRADGLLRRLQQGAKPLKSALYRAIQFENVDRHWPMEDGSGAVSAASARAGVDPLTPIGDVTPGASLVPKGSAGAWDFSGGGWMRARTGRGGGAAASGWDFELTLGWDTVPTIATSEMQTVAHALSTGSAGIIGVGIGKSVDGNTYWTVYEFDPAGGGTFTILSGGSVVESGRVYHVRVKAEQAGADIEFAVYIDGSTSFVDGSGGVTLQMPTEIQVNAAVFDHVPANPSSVSHLAWTSPFRASTVVRQALDGHQGELAGARFARLCTEEGIPFNVR